MRTKLSKGILQMKFMQKTKEKCDKELEELEPQDVLDQHYNANLRKEGQKYVVDNSYLYVERLVFPRMSFKGMNPEIEKLMVEMNADNSEVKDEKQSNETFDVNDEEMTDRYTQYIDNKNSNRKRNRDVFSKKQNRRHEKYKKLRQN